MIKFTISSQFKFLEQSLNHGFRAGSFKFELYLPFKKLKISHVGLGTHLLKTCMVPRPHLRGIVGILVK